MSASEKQLEKTLLEAGKTLFYPPRTSVKKILHLLDKVFICLSDVKQSPSSSIQNALSPVTNALVFERLFKHSNLDVNIAVASCITEVMRINAPNAPYDDEKMKEVFQLIVSSFEHLDDESSLSYTKRISILDCVAKCKVCSVMLDLQFDALLIEMFQHFLKALRDHHPVKVLRAMEDIMTLVLNESNDIPPELLSSILHYLKKDNEVPNITRRLAGQVLFNSASKFKTYLAEAVKSSGVSLDEYSNVVSMICKGDFDDLKQNEVMADKEDHAETEAQPHKRARVQSRSLHKPHGEVDKTAAEGKPSCRNQKRARIQRSSLHKPHGVVDKTAAEGEPSCGNHKSSPELEDSQPCSITHKLAKVKQRIVDTLTSVRHFCNELETKEQGIVDTLTSLRQFRSELETKEETLEASLHEVDVLGEKISRINKIINL